MNKLLTCTHFQWSKTICHFAYSLKNSSLCILFPSTKTAAWNILSKFACTQTMYLFKEECLKNKIIMKLEIYLLFPRF